MKVVRVSAIIIGSIIGAGFASGKEIFEYFAKFGAISLLFVLPLFFILFGFVYAYLIFGAENSKLNLKQSNKLLCKNVKLFGLSFNPFDVGLFLTFLILCSAMFSGLVSLLSTYMPSGHKIIYYIVAIVITYILLKTSFNRFKLISNLVVPLIVVCILLNVVCSLSSNNVASNFGISNILPLPFLTLSYASQNTFFCSFILMRLGKDLNKKECFLTSLITAITLCVLIALGILCFLFNPKLAYCEMPFAEVAISINPVFSIIFALILFGSIITTHATCLTSLKEYFNNDKKYNNIFVMLVLIILLSLFNFGKIIAYFYPIIGAFGLVYLYKILTFSKKI